MRIKVKVTQEHINSGEPQNASACPIACALVEAGYDDVQVDPDDFRLESHDGFRWSGALPKEANEFIAKFDAKEKVEPFEFEVSLESLECIDCGQFDCVDNACQY